MTAASPNDIDFNALIREIRARGPVFPTEVRGALRPFIAALSAFREGRKKDGVGEAMDLAEAVAAYPAARLALDEFALKASEVLGEKGSSEAGPITETSTNGTREPPMIEAPTTTSAADVESVGDSIEADGAIDSAEVVPHATEEPAKTAENETVITSASDGASVVEQLVVEGDSPAPILDPAPTDLDPFPAYEAHPAAEIFPMMGARDLDVLAVDISAHGQHDDIVLYDGKIADGRNRYAACRRAGVIPRFSTWNGAGSLTSWVLSKNLHRRQLTDQQRAMVAARAKEAFMAEAEKRRFANLSKTTGFVDGLDPAHRDAGRSAEKAAGALHVSHDAVKKAAAILRTGDASLIDAVANESVSLDAAAAVAQLPVGEQKKLVESGTVKDAAAKIRRAKKATKERKEKAAEPVVADEPTTSPPPPPTTEPESSVGGTVGASADQGASGETIGFKWSIEGDATVSVRGLRLRISRLANGAEIEVLAPV